MTEGGAAAPGLPAPTGREVLFRTTAKLAAAEEQGPPRLWELIVWRALGNAGVLLFGMLVRPADPDLVLNRVDTTSCASVKVDEASKLLSVASPHYGQLSLYLNDEVDAKTVSDAVSMLQRVHEYRSVREHVLLDMHTIGQQRQLLANDELTESSSDEGYLSESEQDSSMDNNTDVASSSGIPAEPISLGSAKPKPSKPRRSSSHPSSAKAPEPEPVQQLTEEVALEPMTQPLVDACIYCGAGGHLTPHPSVPRNFNGQKVWFCSTCLANWKAYREKAKQAGELMLPGEPNEEICAVCAAMPSTLVMCSECPRSFCSDCLDRLLTIEQKEAMQHDDIWRCFLCVKSRKFKKERASVPTAADIRRMFASSDDEDGERKRRKTMRWSEEHLTAIGEAYNRFGQHGLHQIYNDPELHARIGHRSVESMTVKWQRMSDTEKNKYLRLALQQNGKL